MYFFVIFIIAVILSIDVFFTVLVSPFSHTNKKVFLLPFLVGLFHFIFPIFLYKLTVTVNVNIDNLKYIPSIIFFYFGVSALVSRNNECTIINSLFSIILLSISVSLDSGFTGVSLAFSNINIYIASVIFGIVSFIFTIISIILSIYIKKRIDLNLSLLTGILFIFLSILFLLNKL